MTLTACVCVLAKHVPVELINSLQAYLCPVALLDLTVGVRTGLIVVIALALFKIRIHSVPTRRHPSIESRIVNISPLLRLLLLLIHPPNARKILPQAVTAYWTFAGAKHSNYGAVFARKTARTNCFSAAQQCQLLSTCSH